jgi:PAS domain-containing protein
VGLTVKRTNPHDGHHPRPLAEATKALKRQHADLRRDLARYQLVLDTLPMRIFWKDAEDLRYLGCNLSFAQNSGHHAPADVIGADDFHMGWAAQAEAYRGDDRQVIDSRQGRCNYEEP